MLDRRSRHPLDSSLTEAEEYRLWVEMEAWASALCAMEVPLRKSVGQQAAFCEAILVMLETGMEVPPGLMLRCSSSSCACHSIWKVLQPRLDPLPPFPRSPCSCH